LRVAAVPALLYTEPEAGVREPHRSRSYTTASRSNASSMWI
jgi:hypothetical protein